MITANARLHEMAKMVMGFPPALASSGEDTVSLKGYLRMAVVLLCDNATTVTGSAVTLKQATDVAGSGEKALAFDKMWANEDTGATDTLVETAVTSDTFTTDTTNAKNLMYVIEIEAADLDVANDFDCVRVDLATSVASIIGMLYILYPGKYGKAAGPVPSAILD